MIPTMIYLHIHLGFVLFLHAKLVHSLTNTNDFLLEQANSHKQHAGVAYHLDSSSWPTDHGDSARAKFSLNAGLPSSFDPKDLHIISQPMVSSPQWLYTKGSKSEHIYVLGGSQVTTTSIAKLDAITLDVLQSFQLPASLYLGGLVMHKNGHVYAIHANILYAFWDGDLTNYTSVTVPIVTLNPNLVQTNGMLITQDGLIVLKQWSTMLDDVLFYCAALPFLRNIFLAVIIGSIVTTLFIRKSSFLQTKRNILSLFIGGIIGLIISYVTVIVLIMAVTKKPFDPITFLMSSRLLDSRSGGGEIKFIDPLTLSVITAAVLPERCSIARMAMIAVNNSITGESEDAFILLGDELVYQFRWRPMSKSFHLHRDWTRRYRRFGDGSYQGTGASLYNNTAYFTDNTFPVFLRGQTYRMYRTPLMIDTLDSLYHPMELTIDYSQSKQNIEQQYHNQLKYAREFYDHAKIHAKIEPGIPLTQISPGFMFWSVVVSPLVGDIITWDTVGKGIESRNLLNMSIHWKVNAWQADCITVAADKGHVYISDYSSAPTNVHDWLPIIGRSSINTKYHQVNKYFVVLNSTNGEVLANITIGMNQPIRLSMIIPGGNNDVIIGTPNGLQRIYYDNK